MTRFNKDEMTSEDKAWQQKLFEIWKRTIKESEKKFR